MDRAQSRESAQNYRPDIDGLRAVAILSVVLYHAGVPLFSGGFTGVDIFFVISGYLIGGHIFAELASGSFSFLLFYRRRAKRILPAFYLVMAFALLAAIVLLSPLEASTFAKMAIASVLSVSNVYLLRSANYFQSASELNPLLMTWSLGVEEQFYAVIPLLMVLIGRMRRGLLLPAILALSVLSFAFAWFELGLHPSVVFYLLPSRAWELGAGVTLAVIESSWKSKLLSGRWAHAVGLLGSLLMLAPVFLLTPAVPFPGPAALPSVLGTAMVIAVPLSWFNRKLLSLPPFVFIGKVSYSWYLWHWPLLAFLRIACGGRLPPTAIALTLAASLAAAVLSYYLVEQPFRRSSSAPVPLLLRYAAVTLGFVVMLAVLWGSHGFPRRYPALVQEGERIPDPCMVSYGSDKPNLSPQCYDATDPRPSAVLWGDSHAASLAPALRQTANSQGYNFIQTTRSSCLPTTEAGAMNFNAQHPSNVAECIRFNRRTLDLITADRRVRIVIMAGKWADGFFIDRNSPHADILERSRDSAHVESVRNVRSRSLLSLIQLLKENRKQIILIDDVPNFSFDPSLTFRTSRMPVRHTIAAWLGVGSENFGFAPDGHFTEDEMSTDMLNQIHQRISGTQLVDLKSTLCNRQNLCAYIDGNQLLYSDEQHLTADGARYALRDFRLPRL